MPNTGSRRLGGGREVTVHRNKGVRKVCTCARRRWSGCPHSWFVSFTWKGKTYRFGLDKYLGRHVEGRSEADGEAEKIRVAIRNGTFGAPLPSVDTSSTPQPPVASAFRELAELWQRVYGCRLATAKDDGYRLKQLNAFPARLHGSAVSFGDLPVNTISLLDIEDYRDHRRAGGLSPATINQDLRLMRKIFNWAIRKALMERTPFKIGSEAAIQLEREIPRHRRFEDPQDEDRVLAAASPHLRAVIIGLLETACRVGEILGLQWTDVAMDRRELTVRAEKAKTRTARLVPMSSRLIVVLEMRRVSPSGELFGPDAYVFGDHIGQRVKTVRRAWVAACERAGLKNLQLRDLRHEAGSRFDEAGVPVNFVSRLLGHTNLTTTSRYLNIHRRGLHMAMQKFEESRRLANSLQNRPSSPAQEPSPKDAAITPKVLN